MINNNILGFMSTLELQTLEELFSSYNHKDCIGVEIGSLHGRSSYQIAKTISEGTLYCIDNWSNWKLKSKFTEEQNKKHNFPPEGSLCSLDTFKHNVSECKNIIPIQGNSPNVVKNWEQPIDFLFLDSSHYNPNDWDNIEFWLPKIKSGGIISGHDYRPKIDTVYPDIITNVLRLEKILNQNVHNPSDTSIWYFNIS